MKYYQFRRILLVAVALLAVSSMQAKHFKNFKV